MSELFWPALIVLVIFVLYVVAKVIGYTRTSDAQWQSVDKSKLRVWQDDEDD